MLNVEDNGGGEGVWRGHVDRVGDGEHGDAAPVEGVPLELVRQFHRNPISKIFPMGLKVFF